MDFSPNGHCWKVFNEERQLIVDKQVEHLNVKVRDTISQSKRKSSNSQAVEHSKFEEDKKPKIISRQTLVTETATLPSSTADEPNSCWSDLINEALESSIKYSKNILDCLSTCTDTPYDKNPDTTTILPYDLIDGNTSHVKSHTTATTDTAMNLNIGELLFCQNCFKYFQSPDKLTSHLKLCQVKRPDKDFLLPPVTVTIKEESTDSKESQDGNWNVKSCSSSSSKGNGEEGNSNFCCGQCGRSFRTKDLLGKHNYTHEKSHTCQVCFHSFSQKYHLVKHTELLHRRPKSHDKPYHCHICDKSFTRSRGLTKHTRTHTGEKLHGCPFPFCEKKFPVKSELSSHIRTHTGEKPFKCTICFRSFAEKSTQKTHVYTHTGAKPYKCQLCDKRFNQHSTLKGHMFTHTKNR